MSAAPDSPLPASPEVIPTRIRAVTVFRNGALVVREGRGRGAVEVRDLPLLFASDTLRVRPGQGTVVDLEETVRLLSQPAPLPVPEGELAKIVLELAALDDERRTCAMLREALANLAPTLPDQAAPAGRLVDGKLFADLVGFAGARVQDVAARQAALEKRRVQLEKDKAHLEERARAVPTEAPRVLRGARFTLDAPEAVPFALEYFVPAARWVPTYALHLATTGKNARLVSAALVAQASGEDWSGVELAVSTADLARETALPTLSSWRIGRAQPTSTRAFRPLPTDLPSLFFGYDKSPRRLAPAPDLRSVPPPSPAPARPKQMPVPAETLDDDEDTGKYDLSGISESDAGAFEDERSSSPRMALGRLSEFEEAPTSPEMAEMNAIAKDEAAPQEMAKAKKSAERMSSMAPPPSMAMAMPSRSMRAPAAPPSGGGGRSRGAAAEEEGGVVRAQAELPPRWRTAFMRMAGPDEHQRGSLLPLDPYQRLEWLLEAHDVDGGGEAGGAEHLRRAMATLQQAQFRLEQAPLPRGTSLLAGSHFQSVLRAAAATDVPGDATWYRVEVRVDEGPATLEHRAVPRESNDVWRACRLDVKGAPLPSGPLAVYEDGAFKVNARLDGSGAGKPLDVNLGVDPDVRVLSRTVHTTQAEKGLMSQTSRVEHHVKIEVRSTAKTPALVVVFDRLPVPADGVKDVVVNVLEEKPPLKRTNKDALGNEVTGAVEWRVTIMPGDTQLLELKYAIDLPAKTELEGGNRRE